MKKTILTAVMLLISANAYCELPLQYWTLIGKSSVPVTHRDNQIKENMLNSFTQNEKELFNDPTFHTMLSEINKLSSTTESNVDDASNAYTQVAIKITSYLEALSKEFSSPNSEIPQNLQHDASFQAFRDGFLSSYNHPILKKYFQNWWKI